MKKNYCVSVNITMSRSFEIEADSEQQAKNAVFAMIKANPYDYTHGFTNYVNHEIIDVTKIIDA